MIDIFNKLEKNNIQLIFQGNPLSVTVKKDIAEMTYEITDPDKFSANVQLYLNEFISDFLSMMEDFEE